MTADKLLAIVPEYPERKAKYAPDSVVVEMIASAIKPDDHVEVFMGTWCDDSPREVPKLLKILDVLREQYKRDLAVSFVAVDRSKVKPEALLAGKSVDKVSTFIYYRGNMELGRIVERPVSLFEDDLLVLASK